MVIFIQKSLTSKVSFLGKIVVAKVKATITLKYLNQLEMIIAEQSVKKEYDNIFKAYDMAQIMVSEKNLWKIPVLLR